MVQSGASKTSALLKSPLSSKFYPETLRTFSLNCTRSYG